MKYKKYTALLLAAAIMMQPVCISAQDGYAAAEAADTCTSAAALTALDDSVLTEEIRGVDWVLTPDGTLTISSDEGMEDWKYTGSNYGNYVKKIVIEEGIKEISFFTFLTCRQLEEFYIPDSVNSIHFDWCTSKFIIKCSADSYAKEYAKKNGYIYDTGNNKETEGWEIIGDTLHIYNDKGMAGFCEGSYECAGITNVIVYDGVTYIASNVFEKYETITSVTVPESVDSIGDRAFAGCTSLTDINMPKNVTYMGERIFSSCSSLTDIWLPENITEIPAGMYFYCNLLTKLELPEHITKIGDEAFGYCEGFTQISIPEHITDIGEGAFEGCSNLTELHLSKGMKTVNESAFAECTALKEIVFSNSIESIGREAFRGCTAITELNLPPSLKLIDYKAFSGCSSLTSINFPSSLETISHSAFYDCDNITVLDFPENLTELYYGAFKDCKRLSQINFNNRLELIGERCFENCSALKSVQLPASVTQMGRFAFSAAGLESVVMEEGMEAVGVSAFEDCLSLSSVTLPSTLKTIGSSAFKNNSKLKSVVLPAGLETIGFAAFSNCTTLESVTMPESSGLLNMDESVFYNCYCLKSVSIGKGVDRIYSKAFYGCSSLEELKVAGRNRLVDDGAFYAARPSFHVYCTVNSALEEYVEANNIEHTIIHTADDGTDDSVSGWKLVDGVLTINNDEGMADWAGDKYAVTGAATSGRYIFSNRVKKLVLADGITSILPYAFYNVKIDSIKIPDSVTSIGEEALSCCTNIKELEISAGVEEIGELAIYNMDSLESLIIYTTTDKIHTSNIMCIPFKCLVKCYRGTKTERELSWFGYNYSCINGGEWLISGSELTITCDEDIDDFAASGSAVAANIKTISVKPGVSKIADGAFALCPLLQEITIPNSVSYIGSDIFTSSAAVTVKFAPGSYAESCVSGGALEIKLVGGKGDINIDGTTTATDASELLQKVLDADYKTPYEEKIDTSYTAVFDINGDGSITAGDASCIIQKVLDSSFEF